MDTAVIWENSLVQRMVKAREEAKARMEKIYKPVIKTQHISTVNIDPMKRYVLVVEDNKMISTILEQLLSTMGITSVVAENGRIATEKFNEFLYKGYLFELILMDIIMPEMGGYDSTRLIRMAEETNKLLPHERHFICGFSAHVSADIRKKCEESGMSDILSKPMKSETLEEMVTRNRRATNQLQR